MTNINQLIDKLLDKWAVKLICFVIAIFIYIFHQASVYERQAFIVPLNVIEDGNVVSIGNVPTSVSVIVKAGKEDISQIHSHDMKAFIEMSDVPVAGIYTFNVNVLLSDAMLAMDPLEVRVVPETVKLQVQKKVLKFVPIVPSISGEVAKGYKIDSVTVNPSTIDIYGPETLIVETNEISTTRVNVSNAEKSFTVEANYQPINKIINVDNKGPYKVTVTLTQNVVDKTIKGVQISPVLLSESLKIKGSLPEIDVKINGAELNVEKFSFAKNSVQIDCSQISEPGEYEVPVIVSVPYNITLVDKSIENVKIKVEKADSSSEEASDLTLEV